MSYNPSNIFAQILRGEITCIKIFESEYSLAFHDIHPQAPLHILVIPKGEYCNFHDFHQHAPENLVYGFYHAIQQIIHQYQLEKNGYRLISNSGQDSGQLVDHYHVHILGGKPLGSLVIQGE